MNEHRDEILRELAKISLEIQALRQLIEERVKPPKAPRSNTSARPTRQPISPEQTEEFRSLFDRLYATWRSGDRLAVSEHLEKLSAVELKGFAEANNLNVNSKTTKAKCLQLIDAAYRERKQLTG